ncbi:MAG: restriction endonuclease subunit S [Synergistaceae bacterium]|nr:restriction endonuclease subunit S [Synergistaceae bacterium]
MRLLDKGYTPNSIELEKVYPSGRGHSGRLDVLVKNSDASPFLMIECKTWGAEYNRERARMLKDGGQLFAYYKNATAAKHLCLYASRLSGDRVEYINSIVDVQDEWASLSETKDIHGYWNKEFQENGVFEDYAAPYGVAHKRLTLVELRAMSDEDSGKIYNQIMEILRHNAISDKPNAFNKLLNLFVCKIIDETNAADNDELRFQCWAGLSDEDLQMTLNDLYKSGMWRFLDIDVSDFTTEDFDDFFGKITEMSEIYKRDARQKLVDLRLKKSPNFAFAEVLEERSFRRNAKVVREIVELLQKYRFRYEQKHEFLGSFFELLLNTSMKQEAGQFFTPVPITRFIISSLPLKELTQKLVDGRAPEPLPAVIDYACGSGHFLTEYMSQMQDIIEHRVDKSRMPKELRGKFDAWGGIPKFEWAKDYVYGIDSDDRLVKTTKVSAFFNGDGEAEVIWANGLDNFTHSEEYRGKLKKTLIPEGRDNGQFDILISNPPYSVQAFRSILRRGAETFDLWDGFTDKSSEIECLFVERMKQLLKAGGWAGVILPSSMLSNSGIYSRAREVIFKYFKVKSIVELGSGTFMKTGTNTVILFLERRPDHEHERVTQAIEKFFKDGLDVTAAGIERAFSKFVANVYDGLAFDDYATFVNGAASSAMRSHKLWSDYVREYGDEPYEKALAAEREKLLYFLLTYDQNIVVVRSGQKQDEKAFLGYEFSERRGYEGIKLLPAGTKLFDENGLNPRKVNSYIYKAFLDEPAKEVDEAVAKYVSYGRMSGFFEYGTKKFDKCVNLSKRQRYFAFPIVSIGDCADVKGGKRLAAGESFSSEKTKFPYIRVSDFKNHSVDESDLQYISSEQHKRIENYIIRSADAYISIAGTPGIVGRVPQSLDGANLTENAARLIPYGDKVDCNYLVYICGSEYVQEQIKSLTVGIGTPKLSLERIKGITIPLPPLDVQRQIIAEFETLEREEGSIKKNIDSHKRLANSLFDEMFGDPVRNEKAWTVKPLGALGTLKNGMNFHKSESGVRVKCLGVGDFQANARIDGTDSLAEISLTAMPPNDYLLQDGDIVFVRSNGNKELVGRSVVVYLDKAPVTFSGFCIRFRLADSAVTVVYLSHLLRHSSVKAQMLRDAHGANITNLNQKILAEIRIPLPPLKEQEKFASEIEKQEAEMARLRERLDELKTAKAGILDKYL